MKIRIPFLPAALALVLFSTIGHPLSTACAQGTAFTYQGRLNEAGNPANGSYDFRFRLASDALGNNFAAGPLLSNAVPVSGGLFNVTLDFGMVFGGSNLWLQVDVKTNGAGAYATLTPLQLLTPAPYAITAGNLSDTLPGASLVGTYSGALTFDNAANSFSGSGAGLTGLDASQLSSGTVPEARLDANIARADQVWLLKGNAGTTAGAQFLGTTDHQPLEMKVNGFRGFRLEPTTNNASRSNMVNVVAGSPVNFVLPGVYAATISGGGSANYGGFGSSPNSVASDFGTVGGGYHNMIQAGSLYSIISGGAQNRITNASNSTISGGEANRILGGSLGGGSTVAGGINNGIGLTNVASTTLLLEGGHAIGGGANNRIGPDVSLAVIGGGNGNSIQAGTAFIGGGEFNVVEAGGFRSTISGGSFNTNSGQAAIVPGGERNAARGNYSFAAGRRAKADHHGSFVWADSENADFASTGTNQFLIRASGGVGIGTDEPEAPLHVSEGSAGSVTPIPNAIAVFEKSDHGYLSVLTPTNRESGVLFGNPNHSADGGILFNSTVPRGFAFRTGGNLTRMVIRDNGNVGIGTTSPTNRLHVNGGITCTALVQTSDRNAKENFEAVSPREVLAKVAALPISKWNFKEAQDQRHLGPMAQDFYAAFGLGGSETTITSLDADGVALAAIQGLNEKMESGKQKAETRIANLESENAELRNRLTELERLVGNLLPQATRR